MAEARPKTLLELINRLETSKGQDRFLPLDIATALSGYNYDYQIELTVLLRKALLGEGSLDAALEFSERVNVPWDGPLRKALQAGIERDAIPRFIVTYILCWSGKFGPGDIRGRIAVLEACLEGLKADLRVSQEESDRLRQHRNSVRADLEAKQEECDRLRQDRDRSVGKLVREKAELVKENEKLTQQRDEWRGNSLANAKAMYSAERERDRLGISSQVTRVALDKLWDMLGASNQTEAVVHLKALKDDLMKLTVKADRLMYRADKNFQAAWDAIGQRKEAEAMTEIAENSLVDTLRALKASDDLIVSAQEIITSHLAGKEQGLFETMGQLIELLDGPRQREVQDTTDAILDRYEIT
jgi:hypothetical protein